MFLLLGRLDIKASLPLRMSQAMYIALAKEVPVSVSASVAVSTP